MNSQLTKTIIGAVIAVALAFAVSYGYISQQTADQIQTQANQTLQTGPGMNGQAVPPAPPGQPAPQTTYPPSQPGAIPQGSAQQSR